MYAGTLRVQGLPILPDIGGTGDCELLYLCARNHTLVLNRRKCSLHLKSPQADWEDVLVIEGFRVWIATTRVKHLHICKPNRPGVGTGECL